MIVAEVGRRIDAPDAEAPGFPLENTQLVRRRLRDFFKSQGASALVCSAACGADLLALDEAGQLGLRRRVILPFDVARFKNSSVTDRPGEWGSLFDGIIDEVTHGGLVILPPESANDSARDDEAFARANRRILRDAMDLAAQERTQCVALVVWNGQRRGPTDFTADFADNARRLDCPVKEISTLAVSDIRTRD